MLTRMRMEIERLRRIMEIDRLSGFPGSLLRIFKILNILETKSLLYSIILITTYCGLENKLQPHYLHPHSEIITSPIIIFPICYNIPHEQIFSNMYNTIYPFVTLAGFLKVFIYLFICDSISRSNMSKLCK